MPVNAFAVFLKQQFILARTEVIIFQRNIPVPEFHIVSVYEILYLLSGFHFIKREHSNAVTLFHNGIVTAVLQHVETFDPSWEISVFGPDIFECDLLRDYGKAA